MRFALLALSLSACFGSASELSAAPGDDDADPMQGGLPPGQQCSVAEDCVLAGPTCCDCPTFAIPTNDPKAQACRTVDCDNDTSTCATNVEPACNAGNCVMACAPLTCLECPNGYALEQNDCLSCTCAPPPSTTPKCTVDSDCVRVRDDCCGCAQGGEDTAVAVGDAVAFDQGLQCPSNPQCPGQGNMTEPTCDPAFEARCSNGSCALLKAAMPADACGRADLPDCPAGQTCRINVDPDASQYGLGVCR